MPWDSGYAKYRAKNVSIIVAYERKFDLPVSAVQKPNDDNNFVQRNAPESTATSNSKFSPKYCCPFIGVRPISARSIDVVRNVLDPIETMVFKFRVFVKNNREPFILNERIYNETIINRT